MLSLDEENIANFTRDGLGFEDASLSGQPASLAQEESQVSPHAACSGGRKRVKFGRNRCPRSQLRGHQVTWQLWPMMKVRQGQYERVPSFDRHRHPCAAGQLSCSPTMTTCLLRNAIPACSHAEHLSFNMCVAANERGADTVIALACSGGRQAALFVHSARVGADKCMLRLNHRRTTAVKSPHSNFRMPASGENRRWRRPLDLLRSAARPRVHHSRGLPTLPYHNEMLQSHEYMVCSLALRRTPRR
jgi:hypothetical protein